MGKRSSKKKSRNRRNTSIDEEMMFSETTVTATEETVEEPVTVTEEVETAAEEEAVEEAVETVASESVPDVNIMTELMELQEKLSNLESELSESKHTAKAYLSEIYALRADKNSLKNGYEKLKEQADLLSAENLKLREQLSESERKLSEAMNDIAFIQDQLNQSQQQQDQLYQQTQSSHIRKRDLAAMLLTRILSEID